MECAHACYGFSGFGSQLGFLIAWPIIGIAFTPLIGLALLLKQTQQLAKRAQTRRQGLCRRSVARVRAASDDADLFFAFLQ